MGFRELARTHNQLVEQVKDVQNRHNGLVQGIQEFAGEYQKLAAAHNAHVGRGFFSRLRWLLFGAK